MKEWFLSLSQRERIMVQVAASTLAVFVTYLFVVEPISSRYEKNKRNVSTTTQTLEWMRTAAKEVKLLQSGGLASAKLQGNQSPLSMVDGSARKAGLGSVMKRVQPEGDSGVRIWFENAAFDELIKWLATLEQKHGLSVNEINIEKTELSGLVNVRVFLGS